MNTIIFTVIAALLIGFILGVLLGLFKKIFSVSVDPKISKVRDSLPGVNCGGCGYAGCDSFAAAVVSGDAPASGCVAGGPSVAASLNSILGLSADGADNVKKAAVLACRGTVSCAGTKGVYNGVQTCKAVQLSVNGIKLCASGCIGLGDCVASCLFGALSMGEDGLPHVDYKKCVGCGKCEKACPKKLFTLVNVELKGPMALCSCRSDNKPQIRKDCSAGCFKCGICAKKCPEQCIDLLSGIPHIDYEKCTACGTCVSSCPDKVLKLMSEVIAG
ncbi:RnfABCDGE type electron transport complex subunit B [Treponema sp.]|uniref:RnfABCDGE type electron transport complex subunit B n=1 Tax=Treponema sp. TaxID=166 RepID=UPI003F0E7642